MICVVMVVFKRGFSLVSQEKLLERLDRGDHCGYLIIAETLWTWFQSMMLVAQDVLRSMRLIVSDVAIYSLEAITPKTSTTKTRKT